MHCNEILCFFFELKCSTMNAYWSSLFYGFSSLKSIKMTKKQPFLESHSKKNELFSILTFQVLALRKQLPNSYSFIPFSTHSKN